MRIALVLLTLASCFISCVRKVDVTTNTFSDLTRIPQGFPSGSSFAILGLQENHPMLGKEVAFKISKILAESGYILTDQEHADYLIYFNFDLSSETRIVNVPHFIPGPTETTEKKVSSNNGEIVHYEEKKQGPGSIIFTPEERTLFTHQLQVLVKDQMNEEVWQGSAQAQGSRGDLREEMNYLLVSAFQFFGHNTGKNVSLRLDAKNPNIKWLQDR